MELLEGVVGEDESARLLGYPQNESVTTADRSGRRTHHLAVFDGLLERLHLGRVDPVTERGVDHNGHVLGCEAPVLLEKGLDRFVQLRQAGLGATLGCKIGSIDHDAPAGRRFRFHSSA